ncbi:hypothetical protein ACWIGX_32285 [Streptomyces nigrescens]
MVRQGGLSSVAGTGPALGIGKVVGGMRGAVLGGGVGSVVGGLAVDGQKGGQGLGAALLRNAAAGALLSPSRDELRSLLDGTASGHEMLLLALSGGACAGYAALALREGTSLRPFHADLIARRSHMLRARVTGAGAGLHFPRPGRTDGPKRHRRLHPTSG